MTHKTNFFAKEKNLEYQCFPSKCTLRVELKETTGSKQDSIFFQFFLWLKNTIAILPSVQLEIFFRILTVRNNLTWCAVAYQNNGELQNCIKVRMTQKALVQDYFSFRWDTKLLSSISKFKKFRKQTNPISTQKTTGNHFASSRVGGHQITSCENHWEAFWNTKHYSTSNSCFVAFSFLYHYSKIWGTSFLVSLD